MNAGWGALWGGVKVGGISAFSLTGGGSTALEKKERLAWAGAKAGPEAKEFMRGLGVKKKNSIKFSNANGRGGGWEWVQSGPGSRLVKENTTR